MPVLNRVRRGVVATSAVAILLLATGGMSAAHELRAGFAARCPTAPDFPPPEAKTESVLGAAIITSLIGTLVDTSVAALKKAVNPENATAEGNFLVEGLYTYNSKSNQPALEGEVKLSDRIGCLVVGVGTFADSDAGIAGWTPPFTSANSATNAKAVADALGLTGPPQQLAYYLEAYRVRSSDNTAVTWRPVRLYVSDYLNSGFFAGRSRSTSIEAHFYKPGSDKPFYSQTFAFNNVQKPLDRGPDELKNARSGTWGVLPAAPAIPSKTFTATVDGRPFDPFTLEVRIVEAPKPYALAKAFADAVDANKAQIKTELTNAAIPDAKKAAELAGSGTTLSAIGEYATAYTTAVTSCASAKAGDLAIKLSCSISRDKAQNSRDKALLACRSNQVPSCGTMPELPAAP